ncbi:hypothetical protein F0L17_16685 [Streptomyces sp. TRM43335]|uniref:Uncharacterized protein n=1 Tax=Streptomyces taklimakanensis TaxID=2569853 RepID=A0A6G2BEK8_9ACTN|nr:hypothetical protein [Streptomyces taklimakanensis]MTE20717.1 hypothetical protein [Streptomyces taklimakanensis]
MNSLLLTLGALLAASTLATPAAAADRPGDHPAPVPAGWERVDGPGLAAVTDGAAGGRNEGQTLSAAEEPTADEAELIAMRSVRNERFVATEVNYAAPNTGVLRARSTGVGGWESFAFEWDDVSESYALRSTANGLYVAVEKNFTGDSQYALRARSASAGGWERFDVYYNEGSDRWALQSRLNGLFVAMENNHTGPLQYVLRARSAEVGGSWEEFEFYGLES